MGGSVWSRIINEITPYEKEKLIRWIKFSKANKKYFDEYCEIWITSKATFKNSVFVVQKGFWQFKRKIKVGEDLQIGQKKPTLFLLIMRYAAIFFIAFSLGGILFYYLENNQTINPEQIYSELVVPMGSYAQFTLSDGTVVILNSGSKLKYDRQYGINDRVVQLEGEGYFKIIKDTKRPFIVRTSCLKVTALGTEFNVKAYTLDKTIETTLINGSVKIEPLIDTKNGEITLLKPNQKLTFYKEDIREVDDISETKTMSESNNRPTQVNKSIAIPSFVKENVNVNTVVSWKENRWIFEKQTLSQIAIELERRFDVQIKFESERLKTFRFTGTLLAEPISQVLEVMSLSAPIKFKIKGRVITLYENKNLIESNKNLYNQHN